MILLLGKNDAVEEYAKNVFQVNNAKDIIKYYPFVTTHHTELEKYIDMIKKDNSSVVTTQNLEMIDVLLSSDLDFAVVTVRRYGDEIKARTLPKEEVAANREAWNFDPRD
jgi:hypothetical protein